MSEIRLKDIADRANVAVCTASRVLSGSNLVKRETRQKVLAALQAFESEGRRVKPYMISSLRTKALGLLVSQGRGPNQTEVTMEILQGMQEAAAAQDFAALAAPFDPSAPIPKVRSLFGSALIQGIIVHRVHDEDMPGVVEMIHSAEAPCVVLNRYREDGVHSTCTVNHAAAGRLAVGHLLELGHRRIGIVFGSLHSQPNQVRLAAIREGFPRWRWKLTSGLEAVDCEEAADVVGAARRLVDSKGATAIAASNDRMAARILSDAQSRGLSVPADLSVIGFDGTELCEHTSPPLDSVLIPWAQMARAAVNLILMHTEDLELREAELVWEPRMVERGSCAPPPERAKGGKN